MAIACMQIQPGLQCIGNAMIDLSYVTRILFQVPVLASQSSQSFNMDRMCQQQTGPAKIILSRKV